MPQEHELGGPIYDVIYKQDQAIIKFGRDVEKQWKENDYHNTMPMVPKNSHVWKTADAEIGEYVCIYANTISHSNTDTICRYFIREKNAQAC